MLIDQLFAAKPVPFGARGAPSSIVKAPVEKLTVFFDGTEEDEQGNKKLHGGKEKVLHQYAPSNYAIFQQHFPDNSQQFVPGSIGENISVKDMNDNNVRIGDIYTMGEATIQVGSPRVPCNKISQRFGINNLDRFVNQHNICGWYYRVLNPGVIRVGDSVTLESSSSNAMTIAEFMQCVNNKHASESQLRQAAEQVALDPEWQVRLRKRADSLSQRNVEN
nr:MOSC domain-containing protein [Alteromonas facilis]